MTKPNPNATDIATINKELATLGGFTRADEPVFNPPRVPRIYFFTEQGNPKSEIRAAMRKSIADLEEGDPVIGLDASFMKLGAKTKFVAFPDFLDQFYAIRSTSDLSILKVSRDPKPTSSDKTVKDTGWQENWAALMLVLPEDPNILPIASVSEFMGAKCPFVKSLREEIKNATTKEWVSRTERNAKLIAAGIPPAFRIEATMKTVAVQGRNFPYIRAQADCKVASDDTLRRLSDWSREAKAIEAFNEAKKAYEELVGGLKNIK